MKDSSVVDVSIQLQLSDSTWVKSLAAAHYNVHPDEALELLLSSEIDGAIQRNDADRLISLHQTSGFPLILDDYIAQSAPQWATKAPNRLFEAAAILAQLSLDDQAVQDKIWRTLRLQISHIEQPIVPTDQRRSGLQALLTADGVPAHNTLVKHLVHVLSIERVGIPEASAANAGKQWYSFLTTIAESLPSNESDDDRNKMFSEIPIPANVPYMFGIAESAGADGKVPFSAFKLNDTVVDISNYMVQLLSMDSPPAKVVPIARAFVQSPEYLNWGLIAKTVRERLQTANPSLSSADTLLLMILFEVMAKGQIPSKPGPDELKTLNDDGSLHGILGRALRDDNSELVCLVLHQLMIHRTGSLAGPADHPHYGSLAEANKFVQNLQTAPNDNGLIDCIARRVIEADRFSHLLNAALPDDNNREVYRAILRRVVEFGTYSRLVSKDILTRTSRIADVLGAERTSRLLQKFEIWNISKEIAGDQWTEIDPKFLTLSQPMDTNPNYSYRA